MMVAMEVGSLIRYCANVSRAVLLVATWLSLGSVGSAGVGLSVSYKVVAEAIAALGAVTTDSPRRLFPSATWSPVGSCRNDLPKYSVRIWDGSAPCETR